MNSTQKQATEQKENKKVMINLRDELHGGANSKRDYQLNYGVNQKKRMIERLEALLETAKELPTETYEYGYYGINTTLENYEGKMADLKDKGEDKGHEDEYGWEDEDDYKEWLSKAEEDEYSEEKD